MGIKEIKDSEVIRENEKALAEAMDHNNYFQAYLILYGLIEHILELMLHSHWSIIENIDLLRNRCRNNLPKNHNLPHEFFGELKKLIHDRTALLRVLAHYGMTSANNQMAASTGPMIEKAYRYLKEWAETHADAVDYQEGIIILDKNRENIDINKLIEFLSEIDPHSINDPQFVKSEIEECGLSVEIAIHYNKEKAKPGCFVEEVKGDWGGAGISALSLIYAIFEIVTGTAGTSHHIGRGFQYNDLLDQLKTICDAQKDFT